MIIRVITTTLLLLTAQIVLAQEDPVKGKQTQAEEQVQQTDASFIDEDGDGVNDTVRPIREGRARETEDKRMRKRRRDRFIDIDGDGINDSRCSGIGVHQGKRRGKQKGNQK